MASAQANSVAFKLECKKFLFYRCVKSIGLSVSLQVELLIVFLLFVNFDLLHPITWISSIIGRLFSFFTWFALMPLLFAVVLYFVLLQKSNLYVKKYYSTRMMWFMSTVWQKITFLFFQLLIGFLTAWLYSRYLELDYKHLINQCYGVNCLNSYYTFLIFSGISAGCYHFFKEHLRKEPEIEFPIIQEQKLVKIRSIMYFNLYRTLRNSFMPTACFIFIYWLFGGFVNKRFANTLKIEPDENLDSILDIINNLRLLIYGWVLTSHILSNLHLMQNFTSIFLTEEFDFVIEKNPLLRDNAELTLTDSLAMTEFPIMQLLAALNLYNISLSKMKSKRQEIFALSVPGGHPYVWNQISGGCLSIINDYTKQLSEACKKISNINSAPIFANIEPNDQLAAQKILLRHYNQMHGIRNAISDPLHKESNDSKRLENDPSTVNIMRERISNYCEHVSQHIETVCRSAVYTLPGVRYMFAEEDGAKIIFLLSNSQLIVWLTQGLAGISAASLSEDKYGVVQDVLPQIIKALLKLKLELDKLNSVNLNGKKLDRNFYVLKQAVKRSLYKICDAFGNYMGDLLSDAEDLRLIQSFLMYQET